LLAAVWQLYHHAAVLQATYIAATAFSHALTCPAQQSFEESRAASQHNAMSAMQIAICCLYVHVDQLLRPPEPGKACTLCSKELLLLLLSCCWFTHILLTPQSENITK
jgi:hypothetical protein